MNVIERIQSDWALATEIQKLEARLWHQSQRDGLQVVMFTSAVRGEGKSTTVACLAAAFAQYPNRRILVVDLDVRGPRIARSLGASVRYGFDDVLRSTRSIEEVVVHTELTGLDLLSAREGGADPAVLLQSRPLYDAFHWMRRVYELVLVDAPALMPVADSAMLIPLTDGVVLVAMAGKTTKTQLRNAREQCLSMGANLLGIVVGNMQEAASEYGSEYVAHRRAGSEESHEDLGGSTNQQG